MQVPLNPFKSYCVKIVMAFSSAGRKIYLVGSLRSCTSNFLKKNKKTERTDFEGFFEKLEQVLQRHRVCVRAVLWRLRHILPKPDGTLAPLGMASEEMSGSNEVTDSPEPAVAPRLGHSSDSIFSSRTASALVKAGALSHSTLNSSDLHGGELHSPAGLYTGPTCKAGVI